MTTMTRSVTLNDGTTIPRVALGTYRLNGLRGVDAMLSAVRAGYRMLDSAVNYDNEGAVGEAVRRSGVPRDEIVVTSKLPGRRHAYEEAVDTVHESLYRTRLDHIDLYLIHWPNPSVDRFVEAYGALVDLQRDGLIRSVGVSNFLPEHLTRVIEATGVTPAVNQIELHPYFPQAEAVALHERLGIRTEAWSPIGRAGAVLNEPVVRRIAEEHQVSPVQVILRWHLQRGVVPLPRSTNPHRQRENLDVFSFALEPDEIVRITALARVHGRLNDADPATHEEM